MITGTAIEYIIRHWPIVLFGTVVVIYSLYALIRNYLILYQFKAKKKKLQKELADLQTKYNAKVAVLEARMASLRGKLKEKDKFLIKGNK